MRRATYRTLLALHPPAFRRQFAGEMVWVFDQAAQDRETSGFCFDVALSLARHWLRERLVWTVSGAIAGGLLLIFWMSATAPRIRAKWSVIEMDDLILLALGSLLTISLTLIATVALFQSTRRRRL
jgi:hypothetical protein